ncbi:MAG: acetamidase/formamidase family protein [Defluviitaleaceae bacterium]|nr:acetamidase/formamidase family protein [Defluviitaleaceae bacterium]
MLTITREHVIYDMCREHKPVANVNQDTDFLFETRDASDGQVVTGGEWYAGLDRRRANPATGPVYINGAMPGDTLAVSIKRIDVASAGYVRAGKDKGVLGAYLHGGELVRMNIVKDADTGAEYADFRAAGLRIALNKMVGVIGTAPPDFRSISTIEPGLHGGNLDDKDIGEGSVVLLPVNVPGALLALGDIHAAMGDGESSISGLECEAGVTVSVKVLRGKVYPLPMVVTPRHVSTVASHEDLDKAAELAVANMVDYLCGYEGFSKYHALMMVSMVGDVRICQLVNPKKTARVEFPLEYLTKREVHPC